MGEAKLKKTAVHFGDALVSKALRDGAAVNCPPPTNRGGKVEEAQTGEMSQTVTDRQRVNLSLPPGLHRALTAAADEMGTSVSQVALLAILAGLPTLANQVRSMGALDNG